MTAKKTIRFAPEFLVAGIGASAGGLEAFTRLLQLMPPDSGMAFVLVQHLAQNHKSLLPEILAGVTKMPVLEAQEGLAVKPDHVYVNPPGHDVVLRHGVLRLRKQERENGLHHPIDVFLGSLAADLGSRAVGVVLSGTGSDGTVGLEEIKAAGGITLAQSEQSAVYSGMPQSAISSGNVDFVLSPEEMALQLPRIGRYFSVAKDRGTALSRNALGEIFALLRDATGNDLLDYKPGTISRQVERRMLLKKCQDIAQYVELLRGEPAEVKALYQDVLVNFTRFFRDPEVFDALKTRVFPRLLRSRSDAMPLRIWSAGCATGEEAYSLAISLLEYMEEIGETFPVQIFASDANETAVDRARRGIYPESVALNLSPERLRNYFIRLNGKFQVAPQVRNLCVFAKHNVACDPPFSKVDLVVCRNLLIYFGHALQARVLRLFHYALKPDGFLMLGPSETVGSHVDLFALEDKKSNIYLSKPTILRSAFPIPGRTRQAFDSGAEGGAGDPALVSVEQLADRVVLEKYSPAAVIVNDRLEILQFRGHTGPFLAPAAGEASLNLLKMVHPDLALDLRLALNKAERNHVAVRLERLKFTERGQERALNVEVVPLDAASGYVGCMLVLFELAPEREGGEGGEPLDTDVERLERELAVTRAELRAVIEQLEASSDQLRQVNEELQVSREEWHSANEELQSTNDELETSRTDLQLTNEELVNLNRELESRMDDLRLAAKVFDCALEGIMITDANGVIQSVNPAFTATTGYSAADVVGRTPRSLQSGRHDADFYLKMWDSIRNTGQWRGEIWNRRKNGEIFREWLNISVIRDEKDNVSHYIGIFHTVSPGEDTRDGLM